MQTFTHGETPEKDHELFSRIGELALSKAVQTELGACPTSEPGRIWLVLDGQAGFVSVQLQKNGAAHLRHLWAAQATGKKKLVKGVMAEAQKRQASAVVAVEKSAKIKLFVDLGFKETGTRGQYSTLEYRYESGQSEK